MRRADRRDPLDVRPVVQQHPAAAVDLQVDEPRRQHPARERHPLALRRLRRRHDRRDRAVLDHQRRALAQPLAVEDRGADENAPPHAASLPLSTARAGRGPAACPCPHRTARRVRPCAPPAARSLFFPKKPGEQCRGCGGGERPAGAGEHACAQHELARTCALILPPTGGSRPRAAPGARVGRVGRAGRCPARRDEPRPTAEPDPAPPVIPSPSPCAGAAACRG